MRRIVFWLAFWLVLQGMAVSFGLYMGWQQDQQIRENTRVDDAERCVAAWESRENIRDQSEVAYRRNAETLISLSTTASPERIGQYRETVDRDVAEIRAILPDPECDLASARAVLDE